MKNISRLVRVALALAVVAVGITATGCEDAPTNPYVPQYVVQGYLIVDHPIVDIQLSRSQPVTDTFKVAKGIVDDATVRITGNDHVYQLQFRKKENGHGEYYCPDSTALIQPNTLYTLEITTKDGSTITAQTRTPNRISWVAPPRDTVTLPDKTSAAYKDPPDSLDLSWTPSTIEYLISVRATDTADYGRYLTPPTEQKNMRVNPDIDKFDLHDTDLSRWAFIAKTSTPIVWAIFKWYGEQTVDVYAADDNMIKWFKMTQWTGNPQYDPLLGNVRGDGIGIFGSAAMISKRMFLMMRPG